MKAALALLFVVSVLSATAEVPGLLNHQGKVVVSGTAFNGTGQFKFALVNADGSTTYWSNDGTSESGAAPAEAVSLPVSNGIFSVNLGDTTLSNMTSVPAAAFDHEAVYLRTWFNDGTNGWQQLSPDRRMASVGYALRANESDPLFAASPAAGLTNQQVTNWQSAFTWGNHSSAGYLTAESDPAFTASPAAGIADDDLNAWTAKVGGSGTASYVPKFTASGTIGDSALFSDADGNVGIGTTTPIEALQVGAETGFATARNAIKIGSGGYSDPGGYQTNANGDKLILFNSEGLDARIGIGNLGDMWFKALGQAGPTGSGVFRWFNANSSGVPTERMRIDTNGNVGIGTGTPAYKLDVAGSLNATAITINGTPVASSTDTYWSTAGAGSIQYSGGNVGIGLANPAYLLDVAGDVNVTGNFRVNGQLLGGSGSVTSVAGSGGTTGLTLNGGPITTSGTLTLGGTLALASGGTGATTAAGARTALGLGSAATLAATNANTVSAVVQRDASGNFSAGTITASLTGTATKATNLVGGNGTTLLGAIGYQSALDTTTLLAPNTTTTRKFLRMTGTGTNGAIPAWDTLLAADIPTLNQNTTGTASNVTGTVVVANGGTGATTAATARTSLGAAASGANSDITSLSGLTTDLSVAQGGTGASTLTGYVKGGGTSAMTASATIPGSDISGNITGSAANVTGTVAVANGGTGATTAAAARTNLAAAASGANSDITSLSGLTTDLSVAQGGTGASTLSANKVLVGNGASTPLQPTNLHWDNTNSRLGVGDTTPSYAVDVAGDVNVTGSFRVNGSAVVANPSGSIIQFAGSAAPTGYLLCQGQAVSRTTYAALYAVIGTSYGAGDGSTTFNVPNLQGKVPVGRNSADTSFDALGETGGEKTHTLTEAEMPSHSHSYTSPTTPTNTKAKADGATDSIPTRPLSTSTTTGTAGGISGVTSAHNNLQPYIVLNYIIKF